MRDQVSAVHSAPYFSDVSTGPEDVRADWLATDDGLRIRAASWGHDATKGTVLLFPGRSEYVEKYGPAAGEFLTRGYATLSVDWRGQGLADRIANRPSIGHVRSFLDYQTDVAALVEHAQALNLPRPWHLVAHSMGGAIGLRALLLGLEVNSALFTAPMWGIAMAPRLKPLAWGLSSVSRRLGLEDRFAPGQVPMNYVTIAPFELNTLTSDPEMYEFMRRQMVDHPDLALGGVSLGWLNEALRETRRLMSGPAPDLPCVTFLGSEESIVDPGAIRRRMADWPKGQLVLVPDARHEVMMEQPEIRAQVFDRAAALFADYG